MWLTQQCWEETSCFSERNSLGFSAFPIVGNEGSVWQRYLKKKQTEEHQEKPEKETGQNKGGWKCQNLSV